MTEEALRRTPLYEQHKSLGAKLVPFAGYEMPVQYPTGILAEHKWTRESAGLFDVSHMGQLNFLARDHEMAAQALETVMPGDILGVEKNRIRYTQLLNDDGGIIDDLMVHRLANDSFNLVINASRKEADLERLIQALPDYPLALLEDLALLALQGPKAEASLAEFSPEVSSLRFMEGSVFKIGSKDVAISRCGYTGEDGFEISCLKIDAPMIWNLLLLNADVKPIGLGARDSLRLEAGLCLYGHDIDETTSPIEAGLQWSIAKRRREQGGFPGAARIQAELTNGPARKRVGIKPEARAPAREGTEIQDANGRQIGLVTSGGFGPTVNGPVAVGYVENASSAPGTQLQLIVRGAALPARVVSLPFVPHNFKR